MPGYLVIFLLVIFIGIIFLFYVLIYNKLHHYKVRTEVAENTIDEALRNKFDILVKLNSDILKAAKKDYLKEFIEAKNTKLTNYEADRKLKEAFSIVVSLKNDHKELNKKEVNDLLEKVKTLDEELDAAKNFFNKNTTELNLIIRKFPSNLVARRHNFKIKPYFDNKNMQDAVIDDFKL